MKVRVPYFPFGIQWAMNSAPFFEKLTFPYGTAVPLFVINQVIIYMPLNFWTLCSTTLLYLSPLVPISCYLNYCNFIISLVIKQYMSPTFILLVLIVLGIFHKNFSTSMLIPTHTHAHTHTNMHTYTKHLLHFSVWLLSRNIMVMKSALYLTVEHAVSLQQTSLCICPERILGEFSEITKKLFLELSYIHQFCILSLTSFYLDWFWSFFNHQCQIAISIRLAACSLYKYKMSMCQSFIWLNDGTDKMVERIPRAFEKPSIGIEGELLE